MEDPKPKKAPQAHGLRRAGPGTPVSGLDSQRFLRALEFVMRWEQDGAPDQPTRYGITQGFHDTHGEDSLPNVSHVSPDESRQLYHALWQRVNAKSAEPLDFPTQLARFDTAVTRGENHPTLKLPTEHMLAQRVAGARPEYRQGVANRVGDLWTEIAQTSRRR